MFPENYIPKPEVTNPEQFSISGLITNYPSITHPRHVRLTIKGWINDPF